MFFTRISCSFFFILLLFFSPTHASVTVEDVKEWLPARLHPKAADVVALTKAESLTATVRIAGDTNDYGYSFPGVSAIQQRCLKEIHGRYQQQGLRPTVLDAACGHGRMAWKMIIAGGYVVADEFQEPTRQISRDTMKLAIPFLADNEKLKDVCSSCDGNLLEFDTCLAYKRTYDVTWSGNVIHLFTPAQATAYVGNLFKITNKGGMTFGAVHAPTGTPKMIERFLEEKEAGNPFPGYLTVNKISHQSRNLLTGQKKCLGVEHAGNFPVPPTGMSIINGTPGFYNDNKDASFNESIKNNIEYYSYRTHCAIHLFDPDSIKELLVKAGFVDVEAFFMDSQAKRYNGPLNPKQPNDGPRGVGFSARKP